MRASLLLRNVVPVQGSCSQMARRQAAAVSHPTRPHRSRHLHRHSAAHRSHRQQRLQRQGVGPAARQPAAPAAACRAVGRSRTAERDLCVTATAKSARLWRQGRPIRRFDVTPGSSITCLALTDTRLLLGGTAGAVQHFDLFSGSHSSSRGTAAASRACWHSSSNSSRQQQQQQQQQQAAVVCAQCAFAAHLLASASQQRRASSQPTAAANLQSVHSQGVEDPQHHEQQGQQGSKEQAGQQDCSTAGRTGRYKQRHSSSSSSSSAWKPSGSYAVACRQLSSSHGQFKHQQRCKALGCV
ncbi:hypothetical protein COO60DRAFT_401775 [Scenedesmus sp. NREL 46B-D3]|nr:hypothetical protein COO60DRAFT_401775 [Scenedesmus sp. NREL 46B-D3]